jgi:hypothetical protein
MLRWLNKASERRCDRRAVNMPGRAVIEPMEGRVLFSGWGPWEVSPGRLKPADTNGESSLTAEAQPAYKMNHILSSDSAIASEL